MSAAFVGSAALERERAISNVSSSSARVEMPSGAGPAARDAVLNATVGSLAGDVFHGCALLIINLAMASNFACVIKVAPPRLG